MRRGPGRFLVVAAPMLWLGLFFAAPFVIVLKISLAEAVLGQPPYTPVIAWVDGVGLEIRAALDTYAFLLEDPIYLEAWLNSIRIALIATLAALAIGYPMAYAIAQAPAAWRIALLMLVILPFWTSFLIRVYAWIGLLSANGPVNNALLWLGLIDAPLALLRNEIAILVGIVYSYLPFMVLPLYATLARMDRSLLEAAADLGCRPFRAFLTVTLPLSLPGVLAGSMLVFVPAVGEFVIPDLLGGPGDLMIGKLLWTEFFANRDWPLASAVAVVMLAVVVAPIVLLQRIAERHAARREG